MPCLIWEKCIAFSFRTCTELQKLRPALSLRKTQLPSLNLQDHMQANPAIRPFILCPRKGSGCSRTGATNTSDVDALLSKCQAALLPHWRANGTPSFQTCSVRACRFQYVGSGGKFLADCSALQGAAKPALPFFNPDLCTAGSKAQAVLKSACKANTKLSDLCVST
jgi:hypothetical protein